MGNYNAEEEKEKKVAGITDKKTIFDKNSMLTSILTKTGSIILANIFFIICCLPVITIGASATALIRVCLLLNENADFHLTKEFFTTFVKSLLDATLGWVIFGTILAGMVYIIANNLLAGEGKGSLVTVCICGFVGLLLLIELTFYFAMIARYKNTILNQMKNAFLVGLANLWRTIVIWIIWFIPIFAFVYSPVLVKYVGWVWLLAGFSMFTIVTCKVYKKIFNILEKVDGAAADNLEKADENAVNNNIEEKTEE